MDDFTVIKNRHERQENSDPSQFYGKRIADLQFTDNKLLLTLDNGQVLSIMDDGQSCCEERYMECEDDVKRIVGQTLLGIKVVSMEDDAKAAYCVHEIAFLEIQTDKDVLSFSTHNKHNGYYGGFSLAIYLGDHAHEE